MARKQLCANLRTEYLRVEVSLFVPSEGRILCSPIPVLPSSDCRRSRQERRFNCGTGSYPKNHRKKLQARIHKDSWSLRDESAYQWSAYLSQRRERMLEVV